MYVVLVTDFISQYSLFSAKDVTDKMKTVNAVPVSTVKLDTTNGKCSSDEKCGGANGGSDDREGSDDKEELPSPPAAKLKGGKRKRRSNSDAAGGSQPTLTALFSKMAKRVKSENKKNRLSRR